VQRQESALLEVVATLLALAVSLSRMREVLGIRRRLVPSILLGGPGEGGGQLGAGAEAALAEHAAGDRISARTVFVVDLSTGTVRVDRFELTCLGPA
jgi:hypothetical protein